MALRLDELPADVADLFARYPAARLVAAAAYRQGERHGYREGYDDAHGDVAARLDRAETPIVKHGSKLAAAVAWLDEQLSPGESGQGRALISLAADDGIARRTLHRARAALGVRVEDDPHHPRATLWTRAKPGTRSD
jgi:hypothetical protein